MSANPRERRAANAGRRRLAVCPKVEKKLRFLATAKVHTDVLRCRNRSLCTNSGQTRTTKDFTILWTKSPNSGYEDLYLHYIQLSALFSLCSQSGLYIPVVEADRRIKKLSAASETKFCGHTTSAQCGIWLSGTLGSSKWAWDDILNGVWEK